MKYLILIIFIIVGLTVGIFIGMGGISGVEWVVFIIVFPIAYIFGLILFGKSNRVDEPPAGEEESRWDKK
jgi:hypothetical protein